MRKCERTCNARIPCRRPAGGCFAATRVGATQTVEILKERRQLASLMTGPKFHKLAAAYTDQEAAHQFETHMRSIVLPGVTTYKERATQMQTVLRAAKGKGKKGGDPK